MPSGDRPPSIASEAKQSSLSSAPKLDCFVASLLAMTARSRIDLISSRSSGRGCCYAALTRSVNSSVILFKVDPTRVAISTDGPPPASSPRLAVWDDPRVEDRKTEGLKIDGVAAHDR